MEPFYRGGVSLGKGEFSGIFEPVDNDSIAGGVMLDCPRRKRGLMGRLFDFIFPTYSSYGSDNSKRSWDGYGSGTFWANTYYRPWY